MKIEDDKWLEIYTKHEDSFTVGMVYCQNEDEIIFRAVDDKGMQTGYYAMKKAIIKSLEKDTDYLMKLEKYMEYGDRFLFSSNVVKDITFSSEESLFHQIFEYSKNTNSIISIDMLHSEELKTGFIKEIDDKEIILENIDIETAKLLDVGTYTINDIVIIEFESVDNNLLKYAYETT